MTLSLLTRAALAIIAALTAPLTAVSQQNSQQDIVGVLRPTFEINLDSATKGVPEAYRQQIEDAYKTLRETTSNSIQRLWIDQLKEVGIHAIALKAASPQEANAEAREKGATCLLTTSAKAWRSNGVAAATGRGFLRSLFPSGSDLIGSLPGGSRAAEKLDAKELQALTPHSERHLEAVFSLTKLEGSNLLPQTTIRKKGPETEDLWSQAGSDLADAVKSKVSSSNSSLNEPLPPIKPSGGVRLTTTSGQKMAIGKQERPMPAGPPTVIDLTSQGLAISSAHSNGIIDFDHKTIVTLDREQKTYSLMPWAEYSKLLAHGGGVQNDGHLVAISEPGANPHRYRLESSGAYANQEITVEINTAVPAAVWSNFRSLTSSLTPAFPIRSIIAPGVQPFVADAIWHEAFKLDGEPSSIRIETAYVTPGKKPGRFSTSMITEITFAWAEPADASAFQIGADYKRGAPIDLASFYF